MAANKVGAALASVGALTDVDTTKRNALGTLTFDGDGNEYIYLQGVVGTAAGYWVTFYGDYSTALMLSTPLPGRVAVAMAATVASTYGWYQIGGYTAANVNLAADVSGNHKAIYQTTAGLGTTATAAATKAVIGAWAYGTPAGAGADPRRA